MIKKECFINFCTINQVPAILMAVDKITYERNPWNSNTEEREAAILTLLWL